MINLPKFIPIFPLSNFILFPKATVPLNIFEPRYIKMIDDSMKKNKMIGLIQPKNNNVNSNLNLHKVGCVGKITSFNDLSGGRYLIELNGLSRFKIIKEIVNNKAYRECEINYDDFSNDRQSQKEELKISSLELIFRDLKLLFEKKGYIINWESLEKQNLHEAINALSMASPFSLEEKQILLESQNFEKRKNTLAEILNTYVNDNYDHKTIQ